MRWRSQEIFGDAGFRFAAFLLVVVDLPRYPDVHGVPFAGFLKEEDTNMNLFVYASSNNSMCSRNDTDFRVANLYENHVKPTYSLFNLSYGVSSLVQAFWNFVGV